MPQRVDGQDEPIYRDVQRMSLWVYGVLVAIIGVAGYLAMTLPRPLNIALGFAAGLVFMIGLIIAINFSQRRTEITSTAIQSRFGLTRVELPLQRVQQVEVVDINPWSTVNWGVPGAKLKGGFLDLRSQGGVKLSLDDGKDLVLGSNRPEELAEAIRGQLGQPSHAPTSA